jgi:hypothetical protein
MPIFSLQNHSTSPPVYTRNTVEHPVGAGTGCWITKEVDGKSIDLSCCSPWNSSNLNGSGGTQGAGTLISPRHIIFAPHLAMPVGATIRFVKPNNDIVNVTLTARIKLEYSPTRYPAPDLMVGYLSKEVMGCSIAKVLPDGFLAKIPNWGIGTPILTLDQQEKAIVGEALWLKSYLPPYPWLNYHTEHTVGGKNPLETREAYKFSDATRLAFSEKLVGGDSGNPCFLIIAGEPVLLDTLTYGMGGSGTAISEWKTEINKAMETLSGEDTLYTLDEVDLSGYETDATVDEAPAIVEPSPKVYGVTPTMATKAFYIPTKAGVVTAKDSNVGTATVASVGTKLIVVTANLSTKLEAGDKIIVTSVTGLGEIYTVVTSVWDTNHTDITVVESLVNVAAASTFAYGNAVITLAEGHGFSLNDKVTVCWSTYNRINMTVVTSTDFKITLVATEGTGTTFPANATAVFVAAVPDIHWNTLTNWFTDDYETPADAIPIEGDDVQIYGSIAPDTGPSSLITFNTFYTSQLTAASYPVSKTANIVIGLNGGLTIGPSDGSGLTHVWGGDASAAAYASFSGWSQAGSTSLIPAGTIFYHDSLYMCTTATDSLVFYNNSSSAGALGVNCVFHDTAAVKSGTLVVGDGLILNDTSYIQFSTGAGSAFGSITLNNQAYITASGSGNSAYPITYSGIVTFNHESYLDEVTTAYQGGSFIFNDNSQNRSNHGAAGNNCVFNDKAINVGVCGTGAKFYDKASNTGTCGVGATFYNASTDTGDAQGKIVKNQSWPAVTDVKDDVEYQEHETTHTGTLDIAADNPAIRIFKIGK